MKHEMAEKASIAWFKLAECIERGEKERAFNLHRLLMHSHGDEPYRKKLEADLLLFFDKNSSLDYYFQAAALYRSAGQHNEVVFLYEHVVKIFPDVVELYMPLVEFCQANGWFKKALRYVEELLKLCEKAPNTHQDLLIACVEKRGALRRAQPGMDK